MSLVSVIMPYYKKKLYIEDSIKSILNQTYQKFEIILVNDEKENATREYLKKLINNDSRIKLINNEKNLGAGASRNKAISFANGDYLAFCDCDDLWKENKLERQLRFMKDSNTDFSFTDYEIINENGKKIGFRKAEKIVKLNKLLKSCDIGLSTVILSKKFFVDKKFQFATIKTKEDFVLWIKLLENNVKMLGLNETLTYWRKTKGSLSSSTLQKLFDGYKVYRLYVRFSVIKSLVYLFILSINFLLKK